MVKEIIGDIFEEFESGRINVLVHQANCFHTMGGGIARIIAQRYPEADAADRKTLRGDKEKLGTFTVATLKDGRRIVNVYSQHDTSGGGNTQNDIRDSLEEAMAVTGRATRYDAIVAAFERLERVVSASKDPSKFSLGIPYGYGSDLARGSWTIVRAIIESIFGKSPINVTIVRLPNKPDLP